MTFNRAFAKSECVNPDTVKSAVKSHMDGAAFESWVAPLAFSVDGDVLNLMAHNQFACDFIKSAYLHVLKNVAGEFGLGLRLGVGHMPQPAPNIPINDNHFIRKEFTISSSANQRPTANSQQPTTFDDFIASEENGFALSAIKRAAAGRIPFSPLFVYGASGCGKSMLADCLNASAAGRTLLMRGATFVSEFQRAITDHNVFAFKDLVRDCDTFILDDVQNLCGKRATSEEFMNLIVDLSKSGKNIVLFANAAPNALSGFDRRMQSILSSGLVVDLAAPDRAVRKTMMTRGGISNAVAETLAARIDANGHIVAGALKKIAAWRDMTGADVTMDAAEKLLADTLSTQKTPLVAARAMAARMGIPFDLVTSKSREHRAVHARQIMMAALKSATNLSLSEIGRILGDRDHATVLYGLNQIEKQKQTDLMLCAEIDQM
ncbi:MAG: DnaA/Hda family protein, partial [Proteobacteria bacterium]|nr:DnaA/Hda family protein [Pseudomonadota bacterium]